MATIVKSVDSEARKVVCAPTSPHQCLEDGVKCATHDLWYMLSIQTERVLESVTLADVCERRIRVDADIPGIATSFKD